MTGRNFWLALYIMHQRVIFKLHNVMRKIWFVSNDIRSTTCSVLLSFDGGGTRTTPGSIVSARCKSSASKRTRRSLVERQTATVPGLIRWNRERIRTDWDPVIFPRFQSAVQTAPLRKNQFKSSDDAVVARLILDGRFHVTIGSIKAHSRRITRAGEIFVIPLRAKGEDPPLGSASGNW